MRNSIRWFDDVSVLLAHPSLHIEGAAQSVYHAGEFYKDAVTRSLEDASPMFRDLGVDQPAAQRFESSERAFLIGAH